jgi:hypothetical protein
LLDEIVETYIRPLEEGDERLKSDASSEEAKTAPTGHEVDPLLTTAATAAIAPSLTETFTIVGKNRMNEERQDGLVVKSEPVAEAKVDERSTFKNRNVETSELSDSVGTDWQDEDKLSTKEDDFIKSGDECKNDVFPVSQFKIIKSTDLADDPKRGEVIAPPVKFEQSLFAAATAATVATAGTSATAVTALTAGTSATAATAETAPTSGTAATAPTSATATTATTKRKIYITKLLLSKCKPVPVNNLPKNAERQPNDHVQAVSRWRRHCQSRRVTFTKPPSPLKRNDENTNKMKSYQVVDDVTGRKRQPRVERSRNRSLPKYLERSGANIIKLFSSSL